MGIQISGSVEVRVKRPNEQSVIETVSDFSEESSPDYLRPDDDGLYYYSAIYKAFPDDYELEALVVVNGSRASVESVVVKNAAVDVSAVIESSEDLDATFSTGDAAAQFG